MPYGNKGGRRAPLIIPHDQELSPWTRLIFDAMALYVSLIPLNRSTRRTDAPILAFSQRYCLPQPRDRRRHPNSRS
ncbi:hypothetical protein CCP2SC5_30060 [Azospirillaceae bacterium]